MTFFTELVSDRFTRMIIEKVKQYHHFNGVFAVLHPFIDYNKYLYN